MPTGLSSNQSIPFAGGCLLSDSREFWTLLPSDRTELERQTLQVFCVLQGLSGESKVHELLKLCQQAARSVLMTSHPELTGLPVVWAPPLQLIYPGSQAWTLTTWEQAIEPTLLAQLSVSCNSAPRPLTSPALKEMWKSLSGETCSGSSSTPSKENN